MSSDNKVVSAALSVAAKKKLDQIVNERAIVQKVALGRILEWFVDQDPLMQAVMLQQVPDEDTADLAELLVRKRRAAKLGGKMKRALGGRGEQRKGQTG